jgi:prepilin-type N-terminal cleavage/methylation domain-containing protein
MRPSCARHAFSLVELLIVVSLMGILAALALPSINPGTREELQATAQVVAGDLAYARSLAVANNSSYRVRFELNRNRYILEHSGSNPALNSLPEAPFRSPSDPAHQHIFELADLPHLAGQNVRLLAVATPGGARLTEVEFRSMGETSQAAETIVWLAAGSGSETRYIPIHINPVTGLATLGEYTASGPPASAIAAAIVEP